MAVGGTKLAKLLRNRRELLDLTVRSVADESGISASYLSRLERGERASVSRDVAVRLSQVLGVRDGSLLRACGHEEEADRIVTDRARFRDVVQADSNLTSAQKRILLETYRSWLPDNNP